MPSSRQLISSSVLESAAATVTFSGIPSTYTDLVVRVSARSDSSSARVLVMKINNTTGTSYSDTELIGDGASATSSRNSNNDGTNFGRIPISTDTSNTFGSSEIYIPSYTASQNRAISGINVTENNGTTAYINASAQLYRSTTAVTQLDLYPNAGNFVSGSSFYLYGIKNS
jgi:hypothetical protein